MEANSSAYIEYTATVPLQVSHFVAGTAIIVVNTLVMIAYAIDRDIRKVPGNVFIINLSISDFFTGLDLITRFAWIRLNPIIHIYKSNICLVVGAFHYGSLLTSVIMVIFISWDRFQLVSDPFKYRLRTVRKNLQVAIFGWSLSLIYVGLVISVYPVLYEATRGTPATRAICIETQLSSSYIVISILYEFLLPLFIILFLNGGMIYKLHKATFEKLRKQKEELGGTENIVSSNPSTVSQFDDPQDRAVPRNEPEPQSGGMSNSAGNNGALLNGAPTGSAREARLRESIKKEWNKVKRTARMLHLFVIVFVVCWLPFYVVVIVDLFTPVDGRFITGLSLCLYLNSLINPFLYAFMSRKFRRRFQLMIKCRCRYR